MVNFSLFVDSWRSRFLTGRQQWHSHYRGLLLGYRANTTTIKLYYQVSQLQVGLHLVRTIFARGGQCWGFGVSSQRASTEYGYFFARWLPGHLSNNWFVVDQNNYRRSMYVRLRGGSQAYLSGNLEFNHQALDLELVRDRIIYRLTSSLRVRLGHIRRTSVVDQLFRWSTTEQQRLSLRGLGRKIRSHRLVQQRVSKLNSSNLFVRKFLQRARRRQKLIQNKLNSKVKLNFLTTFVQQRLSAKYLLRARLLFNQLTTFGLGWWPFKTSFNCSRYLRFTFLYETRFFNFLYKFKRFTLFNHQLERLRYFFIRCLRRRRRLKLKKRTKVLHNGILLLSRFYRWSTKEQPVTLHHNRSRAYQKGSSVVRRPVHKSTFFVWLPPTAADERRRRRRVRPFHPPPHLQPMLSIYISRLEREARYREALRQSRYRQKFAGRPFLRNKPKTKIKKFSARRTRRHQKKFCFRRRIKLGQAQTQLILLVGGQLVKHLKISKKWIEKRRARVLTPFFKMELESQPVEPIWIPEDPDAKHDLFRAGPRVVAKPFPFSTPQTRVQRFLTVFKSYAPHLVGSGLTQELLQVGQKTSAILTRRSSLFYGSHFKYCSYFNLIRRQTRSRLRRRTRIWLEERKKEHLQQMKKKEAQERSRTKLLIKLKDDPVPVQNLPTVAKVRPQIKKTHLVKKPTKKVKKIKLQLPRRRRPHSLGNIFVGEPKIQDPILFHRVLKLSSSSSRRVKRVFNFPFYHQNYYTFKSVLYGYSSLVRQRWRPQLALFSARRARRATWQKTQQFTFKPFQNESSFYRWRPRLETLTHNQGQFQLRLFPAVVIGGLLRGKLGSLASEVANLNLPFIYLYTTSVAPYVASYGVIWNSSGASRRGMATLVHHLYRYTTFGTLLQMFLRRLEL